MWKLEDKKVLTVVQDAANDEKPGQVRNIKPETLA